MHVPHIFYERVCAVFFSLQSDLHEKKCTACNACSVCTACNAVRYMWYNIGMYIAVLNTKGGVGKTTTAVYLALAAHNADPDRPVVLIDADPQKSALSWAEIAKENGEELPFEVVEGIEKSFRYNGAHREAIAIVDTAPSGYALEYPVQNADLIIIPTEADGLSLARTYRTLEYVGDTGVVLLNRVRRNTKAFKVAMDMLEKEEIPMFDTVIPDSVAYRTYGTCPRTSGAFADAWMEIEEEMQQ